MPHAKCIADTLHAVLYHGWLMEQQQQPQHKVRLLVVGGGHDAQASEQHTNQHRLDGLDASVVTFLEQRQKQQLFVVVVRDALTVGGCCASRASFAGACLGALVGPEAMRQSWLMRYDAPSKVQQWAQQICQTRKQLGRYTHVPMYPAA
eukprot:GHRR01020054.1.p1 GENE.GHRR01020054.1~~GHRR01020054.1.p1  ORF type:complete len:149 (+),score=59.54 GHRR01020054.1:2671-3117(+)